MDDNVELSTSLTFARIASARPSLPRLVTEDLQGRVNALASALIMQGYEPTFVRLRAGIGKTPQELLQRAFEWWKVNVRPNIGKAPERASTWGNELPVPDAIRDLFSEAWRRTLIAARMTQNFSDEALEKATVSEETRTIKTCVDRLEVAIREHVEQRRVEAECMRTLTIRLAQTCAESEDAHRELSQKLFDCRAAAEAMEHKLLKLDRNIESARIKLQTLRRDLPLQKIRPTAIARKKPRLSRLIGATRLRKRDARR